MNRTQRIVLIVAALAIGVMTLLPPWNFVYDFPGSPNLRGYVREQPFKAERFAGYHPIWQDNTPTDETKIASIFSLPVDASTSLQYFSMRVNTTRLWIQVGAVFAIALLTVGATSSRRV